MGFREKGGHLFQGNKGQILRGTKTILGNRERIIETFPCEVYPLKPALIHV